MPVIGHGFVGAATAGAARRWLAHAPAGLPALVVLAYLPDIAGQMLALMGVEPARLIAHSVLVALALTPLLGAMVARLLAITFGRSALLVSVSLLLHDGLDALQSSDRRLLWPVSGAVWAPAEPLLPRGTVWETALFAPLALAMWALWRGERTTRMRTSGVAVAFAVSVLVGAGAVGALRDRRETEVSIAAHLIEQGRADEGLRLLDSAGRWPSPAKPGRIDYLRGAAYNARGDRASAERYYLLSLRKDPSYFWVVVDLAELGATTGGTADERRRNAEPYVERLRRDFAGEPNVGAVLGRIEREIEGRAPAP